jgi:hypothetical protein
MSIHDLDIQSIERLLVERYARLKRRLPRLNPPQSFNEHVLHRIIYDRDPRLKTVCDKLAVREYIARRLGSQFVVPLLGVWTRASDIPWADLPKRYVLKPNHSSGAVVFAESLSGGPRPPSSVLDSWMQQDYFDRTLEWGYRGLPRRITAEPLLLGPDGRAPMEVQVQVVKGRTVQIGLITGRKHTPERFGDWFYADGLRHPGRTRQPIRHDPLPSIIHKEIVPLAEYIGSSFIHLRVDFYITHGGLKVGELTPYPGGGLSNFDPPDLDEEIGRLWTAIAGNPNYQEGNK